LAMGPRDGAAGFTLLKPARSTSLKMP